MKILDRLQHARPVVLDGATGTQLEARGIDVKNPLWGSVALLTPRGRALTAEVHREYAAHGAELLIANSHNLSADHVSRYLAERPSPPVLDEVLRSRPGDDIDSLTWWLNRTAVDCAKAAAADAGPLTAGCLASPDQPYAEVASLTAAEVEARLILQYEALVAAAPDLIIFEMLTTDADIDGVTRLVRSRPRPVPVAVGVVAGDRGTLGGVPWPEVWARLQPMAPTIVFVQCSRVDRVPSALDALGGVVEGTYLGAYANDGGYDADTQTWSGRRMRPEEFGAAARHWITLGAKAVGGCCGTGPAHIAAIRDAVADVSLSDDVPGADPFPKGTGKPKLDGHDGR